MLGRAFYVGVDVKTKASESSSRGSAGFTTLGMHKSTILLLQLAILLMGCSKQPITNVGIRKASVDGSYQIFYLTEEIALYKDMHETGLRSLPTLVKASPVKPTDFQEDYSTSDDIERHLVSFVWKIGVLQTNIVFGIGLEYTTNGIERRFFAVQGGEPRFFPNETEWRSSLATNATSSANVKLTSEIVAATTVRRVNLPAWSEPVIEGINGSGGTGVST